MSIVVVVGFLVFVYLWVVTWFWCAICLFGWRGLFVCGFVLVSCLGVYCCFCDCLGVLFC